MKDPQFQPYYTPDIGPRRDYSRIPNSSQIVQDLNTAHTNLKRLVGEKDKLENSLRFHTIWARVLTAAVLGSWALILILVQFCLPR